MDLEPRDAWTASVAAMLEGKLKLSGHWSCGDIMGKQKPFANLGGQEGKILDMVFDEARADNLPPATDADLALTAIGATGVPGIVAFVGDGDLPAALLGCCPTLTLADIDAACGKLEDLAILLLTQTRATRHEVAEAIATAGAESPAIGEFGEDALEMLDVLGELGALEPEEIEANRRQLTSALGIKHKRGTRN